MNEVAKEEVSQKVAVSESEARRHAFDTALNAFDIWSRKLDKATEGTTHYQDCEDGLDESRQRLYKVAGV